MPVVPAHGRPSTSPSFLPVKGRKDSRFIFWDAAQATNYILGFSGLELVRNLGGGGQFIVDLYKTNLDGSDLPELVAVKTAKVSKPQEFCADSAPEGFGRNDLFSFVQEIQVLCHMPLQNHPNIITLLGSSWTPDKDGSPVPQLIVEYSSSGTLYQLLQSVPERLDTQTKIDLAYDVAMGLQCIHSCEIVHGDMKLPNIMVFSGEHGRRFTAKISDFGSAIVGDDPEERKVYRGTPGYVPPDVSANVHLTLANLQKCDIFVLGLCLWEIMKDGDHFCDQIGGNHPDPGVVLQHFSYLAEFEKFVDSLQINDNRRASTDQVFVSGQPSENSPVVSMKDILKTLGQGMLNLTRELRWESSRIANYMDTSGLIARRAPLPAPPGLGSMVFRRQAVGIWTAAENRVPRDAQMQSVKNLMELYPTLEGEEKGLALLLISDCFTHGFGTPVNFNQALTYFKLAAETGSLSAQSTIFRISSAVLSQATESLLLHTDAHSVREDLRDLEQRLCLFPNGENYHRRWKEWNLLLLRGIKNSPFQIVQSDGSEITVHPQSEEAMAGLIKSNVRDVFTAYASSESELFSLKMHLLQFIASVGWLDLLIQLTDGTDLLRKLTVRGMSPGDVADIGNVLLAAALHGEASTMRSLFKMGISAAPSADTSMYPGIINVLHFAFVLPEDELEEMVNLSVQHGADVNMINPTNADVRSIPGIFPLELSGPPLDVAISVGHLRLVKILLDLGADPLLECNGSFHKRPHTSLQLAVALHLHQVLDVMLQHLLTPKTVELNSSIYFKGLLHHLSGSIIGGRGIFWRWLLHGSEYRDACSRTVDVCLKYGIGIDDRDEDGNTALLRASFENPSQHYVLEILLEHGANPNLHSNESSFPLSVCANRSCDPVDVNRTVETLLGFGADINTTLDDGRSALHVHAHAGQILSLSTILRTGANIDLEDSARQTVLYFAVMSGSVDCVNLLLDHGANIEAPISQGGEFDHTALAIAVANGLTRITRLLLDRGASLMQPNGTILQTAAWGGRTDILRIMFREYGSILQNPETLQTLNSAGESALHMAASKNLQCVRELVLAGMPINIRDEARYLDSGRTALGSSLEFGTYDITEYLLQNGANPFCRGAMERMAWTFLCEALFLSRRVPRLEETFRTLLEISKPWVEKHDLLRIRDFAGRTILHFAIYYGQVHAVEALVEAGSSVHDRLMKPTSEIWHAEDFSGLDSLQFARKLREYRPEEREALADPDSTPIPDEGIEAVIHYLETMNGEMGALGQGRFSRIKTKLKALVIRNLFPKAVFGHVE